MMKDTVLQRTRRLGDIISLGAGGGQQNATRLGGDRRKDSRIHEQGKRTRQWQRHVLRMQTMRCGEKHWRWTHLPWIEAGSGEGERRESQNKRPSDGEPAVRMYIGGIKRNVMPEAGCGVAPVQRARARSGC